MNRKGAAQCQGLQVGEQMQDRFKSLLCSCKQASLCRLQSWFYILETQRHLYFGAFSLPTGNTKNQDFKGGPIQTANQGSSLENNFLYIYLYIFRHNKKVERLDIRTFLYYLYELVLTQKCCPPNRDNYLDKSYIFFLFTVNLFSTWLLYSASPLKLLLSVVLFF